MNEYGEAMMKEMGGTGLPLTISDFQAQTKDKALALLRKFRALKTPQSRVVRSHMADTAQELNRLCGTWVREYRAALVVWCTNHVEKIVEEHRKSTSSAAKRLGKRLTLKLLRKFLAELHDDTMKRLNELFSTHESIAQRLTGLKESAEKKIMDIEEKEIAKHRQTVSVTFNGQLHAFELEPGMKVQDLINLSRSHFKNLLPSDSIAALALNGAKVPEESPVKDLDLLPTAFLELHCIPNVSNGVDAVMWLFLFFPSGFNG